MFPSIYWTKTSWAPPLSSALLRYSLGQGSVKSFYEEPEENILPLQAKGPCYNSSGVEAGEYSQGTRAWTGVGVFQ